MVDIDGTVRSVSGEALKGIAVSNGEEVVKTDSQGRFRLRVDPQIHPFIFATRPDGFADRGWYVRTPAADGQVELVLEPPAQRPSANRTVRLGHITDIHLGVHVWVPPRNFRRDLCHIQETDPDLDLLIATGDLTAKGDVPSLRAFRDIVARNPQRIIPGYGGHDGRDEPSLPKIRGWQEVMGPTSFSLEVGRWHLILWADQDSCFTPALVPINRRWLEADLAAAAGRRIILAQHEQPTDELLRFVAKRGVEVVLFGHVHSSKCYEHAGVLVLGTPPLVFGGHDTMPRGYRRIELGRSKLSNCYRTFIRRPRRKSKSNRRFNIVWQAQAPACLNRGQPLITGDDVFIPLADEEYRGRSGVLCLSTDKGRRKWLAPTEHSVRGSLDLADGLLLAVTQAGEVLALDKATGKRVWSRKLEGFPHRWIHSGPAVIDGVVVAGNGARGIEAFDLPTGKPLWRWCHPAKLVDWPHYVRPIPLGHRVAIAVRGVGVSCLSARTGRPSWHFAARYDNALPAPLLAGNRLLVPEGRGKFHAADSRHGRRLWTRHTSGPTDRPGSSIVGWTCDNEVLVFNTAEWRQRGTAQCRRVTDGKPLWEFEYEKDLADMLEYSRGGHQALAPPLLTEQVVYLAGLDGRLVALERMTGQRLGSFDLGEPIVSTALLDERSLVAVTYPGSIVCLNVPVPSARQDNADA